MYDISCSLVLYNNNIEEVDNVITCIFNNDLKVLCLVYDNSNIDFSVSKYFSDENVIYYKNETNIGFGKAHNKGFLKSLSMNIKYHLVLNTDLYFDKFTITTLLKEMETDCSIGIIAPKLLNTDNSLQFSAKLLPSFFTLFVRMFNPFIFINKRINFKYELRFFDFSRSVNVPVINGAFLFFRNSVIKEYGMFDERFFMYLEDYDLCRRIHNSYKTIYEPSVTVIHKHNRESRRNLKIKFIHIKSTIKYFNKWGWIFDKNKRKFNSECIELINSFVMDNE